jgi:hypothetical protein
VTGPDREGGRDGDGGLDIEAAWAQIVANWDSPPAPPPVRQPADPGRHADPAGPDGPGATAAPLPSRPTGRTPERGAPAEQAGHGDAGLPGAVEGPPPAWPDAVPRGGTAPPDGRHAAHDRRRGDQRPGDAPPPGEPALVGAGADLPGGHGDDHGDDDPDEGRFVPPEPPPLPRGDLLSRLAWSGVLGSPLFFVLAALFWRGVPRPLVVLAVAAFIAGFGVLVARLPDRRDRDGWDDGAVL